MSAIQEYTLSEVSKHTTKEDLYIVVHDKVYDCSSFVEEHPGGEEVLLDCAGEDATKAFTDIGHSDEAHEILNGLLIGTYKRQPGDIVQYEKELSKASDTVHMANSGIGLYAALLIGSISMFIVYYSL